MAEKIITGADFQKRNRKIVEGRGNEEEEKKKEMFELLKSTIISTVNSEWEKTGDEIVKFINIQIHLGTSEIYFLNDNEKDVASWLKETMKLNLFKDKELGYLLEVPQEQ